MTDVIADEAFALANLRPKTTGLPMVVWLRERGNERHDVRVKVCRSHGDQLEWDNMVSVAVRPQARVTAGTLTVDDAKLVRRWVGLNRQTIIDYWDGTIDAADLIARLQRLED